MRRAAAFLAVMAGAALGRATAPQDAPRPAPPGAAAPARPPSVHDPSTIIKHKDTYWAFATGRGVASWRSKNLVTWEPGPPVFATPPAWITDVVPTQRGHFWAPDVIFRDGRYLLYYSVSAFGKNTSAIALATNPTLDPADPEYRWTDRGIVVRSGPADDFNAIDPNVVGGANDTLWLAFGSFWGGIRLVALDPKTGMRPDPPAPVVPLANKAQIEAVAIHRRGDDFYQFVNWGWCCRGVRSTYSIRVGRSRSIAGPYLDRDGVDLRDGGGTLVLGTEGDFIGPGHAGFLRDGGRDLMSYHFYDGRRNGRARLAIRPLEWDADGWPRVGGPPITPAEGP